MVSMQHADDLNPKLTASDRLVVKDLFADANVKGMHAHVSPYVSTSQTGWLTDT